MLEGVVRRVVQRVSGGYGRGVVKGVVMWSELEKGVIRLVMEGVVRGGKVWWRCGQGCGQE